MENELKLYVWEGILTDYKDGIAFAFAKDPHEARKLLAEKRGYMHEDFLQEPREIKKPEAFYVYGSQ